MNRKGFKMTNVHDLAVKLLKFSEDNDTYEFRDIVESGDQAIKTLAGIEADLEKGNVDTYIEALSEFIDERNNPLDSSFKAAALNCELLAFKLTFDPKSCFAL